MSFVGIPLGALAIASIVTLLYHERKWKRNGTGTGTVVAAVPEQSYQTKQGQSKYYGLHQSLNDTLGHSQGYLQQPVELTGQALPELR